jgi:hypothetical protein
MARIRTPLSVVPVGLFPSPGKCAPVAAQNLLPPQLDLVVGRLVRRADSAFGRQRGGDDRGLGSAVHLLDAEHHPRLDLRDPRRVI